MKAKSILILAKLAMLVAIGPVTQSAESETGERSATSSPISKANTAQDDTVITDTLTTLAATPRSPKELLQDYEAEMAAITQRFSATLAGITEAVQRGELTSEQGQKISAEQYEMAEMQFELLSAWRAMLEQDLARVPGPAAEATPTSADDNDIVTVALPFSSFQLNSSVVEYLRLSKSQAEAIQQVCPFGRAA
jgi:hypothetical protein